MRRSVAALLGVGLLSLALTGVSTPVPPQQTALGKTVSDLAYVSDGNPAHRLDLYLPTSPGPHPLVIYIHGGSWAFGDKAMAAGQANAYDALRRTLVSHGYAVASINYRFSAEARYPAQLDDARDAVRFLSEHASDYQLDPDRFVAAGDSAGGQLALMLGVGPAATVPEDPHEIYGSSRVRAVVSYYGVTDLSSIFDDRTSAGCLPAYGPPAQSAEGALVGGDPRSGKGKLRARAGSPGTYADKATVPILLFQGTQDCIVPAAQATRFADAVTAGGGTAQVVTIPAGHAWPVFFRDPALQQQLLDFLDRYDS